MRQVRRCALCGAVEVRKDRAWLSRDGTTGTASGTAWRPGDTLPVHAGAAYIPTRHQKTDDAHCR